MPINKSVISNGDLALKYAIKQSNLIASAFDQKFKQLDNVLKQKLAELKSYATDKKLAEKRIKETERRLAWLEDIKNEVASILEI